MHRYEVALMMNEKRLTNSFKSYIGLDDDEQVICILILCYYLLATVSKCQLFNFDVMPQKNIFLTFY